MGRGRWPGAIIAIELVAFGILHIIGLVLATVGLFVVYLVSCRLNPRVRHMTGFRHCNGRGEVQGWLFPWSFHKCPGCTGGRQIRWGARFFGQPHIQSEHGRNTATRQMAKNRNAWR
jgi:hypothetical protein